MYRTGTTEDKWAQTGWKIEQKYANKVLLGNWAEERLQVGILSVYCLFHFYANIEIRGLDLSIQLKLNVETHAMCAFSCCRSKT